ncbi:MAG: factor-independent urate hydroxylase [Mucilaginibacter sp.]|uniref:factor-independent urate hydroxylase n=1 Tax=Mucilaginibacter sp. TaxID=1882438 RepID=UPI003264ACE9
MNIKLGKNAYGKNAVNLSKIIRHDDHHEFRQISVNSALEGDFETAHTEGDNSKILATDTQKNTVYILAKEHFTKGIEDFGLYLSNFFFSNNPQVSKVNIEISEHLYTRMAFDGTVHPHAYVSSGDEKHTTTIVQNKDSITITAGIKDLLILKTTDSAFTGYIKEPYTILKETTDRILATKCEATWTYNSINIDFTAMFDQIRTTLLKTFAFHNSLSVQQTLYAMGEAVLQTYPEVTEISLIMPNKHHIPYNMEPFGMDNKNEIFMATDEPFGYITGTVIRG